MMNHARTRPAVPTTRWRARLALGAAAIGFVALFASVPLTEAAATGRAASTPATAGVWQRQAIAQVSDPYGNLGAISCPSAAFCEAVGNVTSSNGGTGVSPFASSWNGHTWKVQKPPPFGAGVADVSCVSAKTCLAVGTFYPSGLSVATGATAATWNGKRWAKVKVPIPSGVSISRLSGVSCVSAKFCIAVGSGSTRSGHAVTLAVRWNGSHLTALAVPTPPKAIETDLDGVSCTEAAACVAVGNATISQGLGVAQKPLAALWNGKAWTLSSPAVAAKTVDNALVSVSCRSLTSCQAVGTAGTKGTDAQRTLAERLSGHRWTVEKTPDVAGRAADSLSAVRCTSSVACTAVGYSSDKSLNATPLTVVWNGHSWSNQPVPHPSGAPSSQLTGLSCPTAKTCSAVGASFPVNLPALALAERRSGHSWKIEKSADGTVQLGNELASVSCPSTTTCVAVGQYESFGVNESNYPLAAILANGVWHLSRLAVQQNATAGELDHVSCASATSCIAVGSVTIPGGLLGTQVTVVESWNGTAWSVISLPTPTDIDSITLTGVACTATGCQVVGSGTDQNSGLTVPVAARWTGSSWTEQTAAVPSGSTYADLQAVSCPAASNCTAVGQYYDASADAHPFAEVWNGTTWQLQTMPDVTGGSDVSLTAVACRASGACLAVGSAGDVGQVTEQFFGFAESRTGSTWSAGPALDPPGVVDTLDGFPAASPTAVACPTDAACTVVGGYDTGAGTPNHFLTAEWGGGAWTYDSVTAPSGGELDGLACSAAATCLAVGDGLDGVNLVETEG